MSDPSLNGPIRPVRGSMPKFYRQITNMLIDQGWTYVPSDRGRKHKLIPPDPDKPICQVPSTPKWRQANAPWISQLRRSGAVFDNDELLRLADQESRVRLRRSMREQAREVEVDDTVTAISTRGQFWRPPEPEPEPEPEPVRVRVVVPRSDPDAQGTAWTLGQARDMLRQGYHIEKVVKRTGWGVNHLRDLVDPSGYYHFER